MAAIGGPVWAQTTGTIVRTDQAAEVTTTYYLSRCNNVYLGSKCTTSTPDSGCEPCSSPGGGMSVTNCTSPSPVPGPDPNTWGMSFIDGVTFNHHHMALDYFAKSGGAGCVGCGAVSAGNSLPSFSVQRRHRYRDMTQWSSFGPGVFLNYDTKLRIYLSGAGSVVELFDPNDVFPRKLVDGVDGDPLDGVYNDVYSGTASGLRLLDEGGQTTLRLYDAVSAELPARDGRKFRFDVVNLKRTRPFSTAGHTGQALKFDGVNDYVDVGTPAGLNFAGQITIAAWIKPTATSGIRNIVCHGPSTETYLRINSGKYEVGSYNGTDHRAIAAIPGGDLNTWVHLAGVYDGANWKLYRNGVLAATAADAVGALVGTGKWGFGAYGAGNSRFFAGDLDEVQIYSRGLAPSEVSDVMNTGALADVLSNWPLEGGKAVDAAADNDGIPGGVGNPVGRLAKYSDRTGYAQTIAYKTFTEAELEASPERQWQIDTVVDANGRTATFTYLPTQVSARWVVSKIVLPNSSEIVYDYTDKLSAVHHPDGTTSTFGFSVDPTTGHTVVAYVDPGAEGTHRRKTVALTSVITGVPTAAAGVTVVNQASMLVRYVVNGAGELAYMNVTPPTGVDNPNTMIVYEGGGKARKVHAGWEDKHFADGWTFGDPANGYLAFQGAFEAAYPKVVNTDHDQLRRGAIPRVQDAQGRSFTYEYDAEYFPTKKTYLGDGTFETWQYNAFKQVTRHRDRLGRVTRSTFDAQGNTLQQEEGILEVGGVDQNQPEYAVQSWEYYPAGDAAQFLLKAAIDANGNRTEYAYDARRLLQEIREPNDDGVGNHVAQSFAYDAAGRLTSSTDAIGRTVGYEYDARDRVVKVTYMDGSSDETTFGAAGSADENLVASQRDRNGNLTTFAYDSTGRPVLQTTAANDPAVAVSRSCTYLDGTSQLLTCTTAGETTSRQYDYRGREVANTVQPRVGKTLTSSSVYQKNELVQTVDPYGRKTYNVYRPSDGALIRTVEGAVASDGVANPASIARNLGPNAKFAVSDFVLDAEGQIVKTVDPRGIERTTVFDSRGRGVEQVEAAGTADSAKTVRVYDAVGNIVEIQHPRQFDPTDSAFGACRTTKVYTARNLLKSRTEAAGLPIAATTSYTYNPDRTLNVTTDARGHDWTTLWSACCANRRTGSIDPIGAGSSVEYDHFGNVVFSQKLQGTTIFNQITTRYDARNRPVATTVWLVDAPAVDPQAPPVAGEGGVPAESGLTTRYFYDDDLDDGAGLDAQFPLHLAGLDLGAGCDGSATLVVNPAGERTLTIVDGAGRDIRSVRLGAAGEALAMNSVVYDAVVALAGFGDLLEIQTDGALGRVSRVQTDGLGRTLRKIDALGKISTATFDAVGNRLSFRDPNGVGLEVVYDARNRATSRTDRVGSTTTFGYDRSSNAVRTTDPKGRTTTSSFDARDRRVAQVNRSGDPPCTWTYDGNGNILSLVDSEARTTLYDYDERNLLVRETYPGHVDGSTPGSAGYEIVEYAFDGAGRMIRRTLQQGDSCTFVYDRASRNLTREYRTLANSPAGPIADADVFTYDGARRPLTAVSGRYANTTTLAYDEAGRLVSESLAIGGKTYTVRSKHDGASRRIGTFYPDNFDPTTPTVERIPSPRDEMLEVRYSGAIDSKTYDDGGRVTARTLGNGLTESWTYRLDDQAAAIDTPLVGSFTYAYDANKNRIGLTIGGTMSSFGWTVAHDHEDRLTSWTRSDAQSARSWTLSSMGDWTSFTSDGVAQSRTHGPSHQLASIDGAALDYDGNGNLTAAPGLGPFVWDFENRLKSAGPAGGALDFAYDAFGRRVKSGDVVIVWDGNQEIAEYTFGAAAASPLRKGIYGAYVDDRLATDETGVGLRYLHPDGNFNIVCMTDAAGTVVERYGYDAYGRHFSCGAVPPASPTYGDVPSAVTGNRYLFSGRRLDSDGLYDFRNRRYSPALGRFISRDPLLYDDGPNLYQYVGGKPLQALDPYGTKIYVTDEAGGGYRKEEGMPTVDRWGYGLEETLSNLKKICPQAKLFLSRKARTTSGRFLNNEGKLDPVVTRTVYEVLSSVEFEKPKNGDRNRTGCCCLFDLLKSPGAFTIRPVSFDPNVGGSAEGPHTRHQDKRGDEIENPGAGKPYQQNLAIFQNDPEILAPPSGGTFLTTNSKSHVEFGYYDTKGRIQRHSSATILAHELCGHGWRTQQGTDKAEGQGPRQYHDTAVSTEVEIGNEMSGGARPDRGLSGNEPRRGETLWREKRPNGNVGPWRDLSTSGNQGMEDLPNR